VYVYTYIVNDSKINAGISTATAATRRHLYRTEKDIAVCSMRVIAAVHATVCIHTLLVGSLYEQ
jgi:hypothetical protein